MNLAQSYNVGIKLASEHRLPEAIEQFVAVLDAQPGFEHGHADFNLAGCYEDIGDYEKAERHFRQALHLDPKSPIFLGGLASFTLLHGDPHESLDLHCRLVREGEGINRLSLMSIIATLANKVGKRLEDLDIRDASRHEK